MRKYRLRLRRAPIGPNGYGVVVPAALGGPRSVGRAVVKPAVRLRRPSSAVRRRHILAAMFVVLVAAVAVAVGTGAGALWWFVVAFLPVVCAYVTVVMRARRLTAEREINAAFFGSSTRGLVGLEDMFVVRREPPLAGFETTRASSAR